MNVEASPPPSGPVKKPQRQRFIVKTHKPEAPEDQKRLVLQLQKKVDDKVLRLASLHRPQNGEIHSAKESISRDIELAFDDLSSKQNERLVKAEGLLEAARRKIGILEMVIGNGSADSGRQKGAADGGAGAGKAPTPASQQSRDVFGVGGANEGEEAVAAALRGNIFRIKAGGEEGGELIAMSPSTLKAHLRFVLAAASGRRSSASGAAQEDQVSEDGMDVVVDEVAPNDAHRGTPLGAPMPNVRSGLFGTSLNAGRGDGGNGEKVEREKRGGGDLQRTSLFDARLDSAAFGVSESDSRTGKTGGRRSHSTDPVYSAILTTAGCGQTLSVFASVRPRNKCRLAPTFCLRLIGRTSEYQRGNRLHKT